MNTPTLDGRSKRAAQNRENRRSQILETALDLFSQRGYHQTSISDIVREANIARGTFYLYFDSKQAIFQELLENLLSELRTSIVGVDTSTDAAPLKDQLHQIVRNILETALDNRALTQIIFRAAVGVDAELDQRLDTFYNNLHQFVDLSLQQGQKLGLIRSMNTYVASRCVLGSIRGIVEHGILDHNEAEDTEQLATHILDFHLNGLVAS